MKSIFAMAAKQRTNLKSSLEAENPKKTKKISREKEQAAHVPSAKPAESQVQPTMQLDLGDLIGVPDEQPRLIFFTGEVSEESIMGVIAQLTMMASKDPSEPIVLVISTYGGSVHEMFGLYDVIKWLPCPVHTIGIGKIMSAGVLLLASGEKGNRMIGEHSRVMLHPMMAGHFGNVFELRNQMKELESMQSAMESCLARESGKSHKELKDLMEAGRDSYLTAQEAIDFGIADGMISYKTKIKLPE